MIYKSHNTYKSDDDLTTSKSVAAITKESVSDLSKELLLKKEVKVSSSARGTETIDNEPSNRCFSSPKK